MRREKVKSKRPGFGLVGGENRLRERSASTKKGSAERSSEIRCRSVAATMRPSRLSRISEAAPISST
jgi:hypothetical protein